MLYRVPIGRRGKVGEPERVPLTGDWEQVSGINANGIARTPDGDALLVVNTASGGLYRVNPHNGNAQQVRLRDKALPNGEATLLNGDGMLLLGRTLYVVQNRLNQVTKVVLDRDGSDGWIVGRMSSKDYFDVPTTVAAFGQRLYLPNARFGTTPTPDTADYWITAIPRF